MEPKKSAPPIVTERKKRSLTQKMVADFAGVSLATIQRAEARKPIRPDSQLQLCKFFGMTAEQLGLYHENVEQNDANIKVGYNTFVSLGLPNPSHHPSYLNEVSTMEQTLTEKLDNAESIINLSWEAWFASRPQKAAKEINRLLPGLMQMLYLPYATQTLRIKELAIRSHGLLGAISLDSLQNDTALYHYSQAHKLAVDLRDDNLTATYLALIGDVLRRQNDKAKAIRNMEQARDLIANSEPAARGLILQLLAYTYGDVGREADFETTISEATDLLSFTGEGRDTAKKEFIPFEIFEIRGKVNRDLGKPLAAIPYLDLAEKSLDRVESVTPRWHALLEISRAQAYCDSGDLSTGIKIASDGFMMAYKSQSPRQMNRVRKLLKKLESGPSKNHKSVTELKELVSDAYMRLDLEK
ncbi:helix-turn-helix transcriptional regulator [Dictyobacter arantiisoli]|uniref:HTH cro/C1-type domain-containing protein n=1 Tax=Dictyobacter arantiisoli TaxID=2014874 RepID=A0A5A5T770_9CHLR|nr:helix-turn-helix transcriptional regulator [Dictyobacter arantiisoli]GCF07320.1 hypothetical protein KDI_08840 [Dictyobacter arantiisoli]